VFIAENAPDCGHACAGFSQVLGGSRRPSSFISSITALIAAVRLVSGRSGVRALILQAAFDYGKCIVDREADVDHQWQRTVAVAHCAAFKPNAPLSLRRRRPTQIAPRALSGAPRRCKRCWWSSNR
jgi:hypothetical protein